MHWEVASTLIKDKKSTFEKMNVPTIKKLNFMLSQFDDKKQDEAEKRYMLATTFYMANFYDFDEEQKLAFDAIQRNVASQYFGGVYGNQIK